MANHALRRLRAEEIPFLEVAIAVATMVLLLGLKWFYVRNQPWDSDEPQHLHVVWAWASGFLPYRDVFDNHSPFFQAISAPIFALFGERADIVTCMRWFMLPIDCLILFLLYRLGARLFSPRVGLWGMLLAATYPDFYLQLGEYRPDLFWAALWLWMLNILVGGPLRPRRYFGFGLVCGFAFTVSMKTTFLLATILVAASVAMILGRFLPFSRPEVRASPREVLLEVSALLTGILIPPALVILFFASQGALSQLIYCVITHNLMPGGDPWSLLADRTRDIRFWLFLFTLGGGWFLVRKGSDRSSGLRQLFFFSVVGFYCAILFTFWPLVSKQDYIPFFPIISLAVAVPLLLLAEWMQKFLPQFIIPAAVIACELASLVSGHQPFKKTNQRNVQLIADTLRLTHPGETVLDSKGQTIFRPRPYFYVFEQITRERVEQGKLPDDCPERLLAAGTPVVVDSHWLTPRTGNFVNGNYLSVGSLMVLGKKLPPAQNGIVEFEIVIPEKYAIVDRKGPVIGSLDGSPLDGPRHLNPGHHMLLQNAPTDSGVALWARAVEKGFSPFGTVHN
jgi:hypothetical protein